MDVKNVRPILKPKNPKVQDPPRYPKLITPIEDEVKREFARSMGAMIREVTDLLMKPIG